MRTLALSLSVGLSALLLPVVACTTDPTTGETPDGGNGTSDAAIDSAAPNDASAGDGAVDSAADSAVADSGVSDAATLPDAMPPVACSALGEASGTTVTVVPASVGATSYSVGDNCAGVFVTPSAKVVKCPYAGCVAANVNGYPQVAGGTATSSQLTAVATSGDVFFARFGNGGPDGAFFKVSSALAGSPTLVHEAPSSYLQEAVVYRWGATAVFQRTALGNNRIPTLYLAPPTPATAPVSLASGPNGAVGFTVRSATEAYSYGFGAIPGGPVGALTKLTRELGTGAITRVEGIAPASVPGPFPNANWLNTVSQIIALPETLLVVRTANNAVTATLCDYAAATPCAMETVLPAASTLNLTRFTYAHGRVYAVKVVAGVASLVQCASPAFAAGTCSWAPFGAPLAAGTTFGPFDSDENHLYARTVTATGAGDVIRIAR